MFIQDSTERIGGLSKPSLEDDNMELDLEALNRIRAKGYKIMLVDVEYEDLWYVVSPNGERSVYFRRIKNLIEAFDRQK